MIQVDIGGHPPIPLGAPPLSISVFQFRHNLLFLAVFRVLNFRSRFEDLNDVFWEYREQHGSMDRCFSLKICIPQIDISNKLCFASNGDRMPKLRPREVETPIYPNGAHSFGASSPRVRVLDVQDFTLFLNNKQAHKPHCNSIQRPVAATSLLRDKLPAPQLVYFHSVCKQIPVL